MKIRLDISLFDSLPNVFKCTVRTPTFKNGKAYKSITQKGVFYKHLFEIKQDPKNYIFNFKGEFYDIYFNDVYSFLEYASIDSEIKST